MYKVIIKNSNKVFVEFSVSEKDLDDAKLYYGEGAFHGHSLKEQMDMSAIYIVKSYPFKTKIDMIKNIGVEWELINNEGKNIL